MDSSKASSSSHPAHLALSINKDEELPEKPYGFSGSSSSLRFISSQVLAPLHQVVVRLLQGFSNLGFDFFRKLRIVLDDLLHGITPLAQTGIAIAEP